MPEIVEYRGVESLVAAEVLTDDESEITFGPVVPVAGVAEVQKTTDSSSEAHYYDNIPAVVVSNQSSDTININVSAIPLDVVGWLTGQTYDEDTGALIEESRTLKYFAIGYKTKKTNGDEVYVWRLKGSFNVPDQTNATEDNGTSANGQTLVYTGISTTHKFEATGRGAKAVNVDVGLDRADVSAFFTAVTTPDTLTAKTAYTLSVTQAANTTVTVKKGSATVASGATIHAGDVLKISVTGGTITVNGTGFISGDMHVVTGNVAVVSTASA